MNTNQEEGTMNTKCNSYGGGACVPPPVTTTTTTSIGTAVHTTPGDNQLPFTGGDVVALFISGMILLLAGAAARMTAGRLR